MEHLSGLILLFIAKKCGPEVTNRKKMKMERREKSKPKIPSQQNLRRPIPAGGDIVCVGRTRTDFASQTKVCNLYKIWALRKYVEDSDIRKNISVY